MVNMNTPHGKVATKLIEISRASDHLHEGGRSPNVADEGRPDARAEPASLRNRAEVINYALWLGSI